MPESTLDVADERARNLLSSISERQFTADEAQPLDQINTDSPDLLLFLKRIALERDVTVDDAIAIQQRLDKEQQTRLRAEIDRREGCFAQADGMALFKVHNTAGRKIDVIAASADCAKFFAHWFGHVHEEGNASVFRYKDEYVRDLRSKKPAIWQAIRAGIPGVIKSVGNHAIVKGETETVYNPIRMLSTDE